MYGHSHRSEFEISYSDYSARSAATAISITYVAPALTPSSGNPSFRVYTIDPETLATLDFVDYFSNMSAPSFQIQPEWQPYYSARAAYAPLLADPPHSPEAPLDGAFWHRVTEGFERNETAFQEFVTRLSRGYIRKTCSEYCKKRWLGHLRAGSSEHNGDTVPAGLHIDAEAMTDVLDVGLDRWRGGAMGLTKRAALSAGRVNAPPVDPGEEDPAHAGCSLHAQDAGIVLRQMVRGFDLHPISVRPDFMRRTGYVEDVEVAEDDAGSALGGCEDSTDTETGCTSLTVTSGYQLEILLYALAFLLQERDVLEETY
jgi:hypothetical protein